MQKENRKETRYEKMIRILSGLCFISVLVFVIAGFIVSPDLKLFSESARVYGEEWIRENPDGTSKAYKMPMSLPLADGESAIFHTTLPKDVTDGMYLAIYTGKSFAMYVGGKEIYRFDNSISRLPGNITKAIVVPIPLREEYAGERMTMRIANDKFDRNTINTAYIGSMMGIMIQLVRNYSLQFLMAILLILASVIIIIIFAYIEKRDGRRAPLIYLAEGILLICLWILFDSPMFQLVFQTYFVDGVTGFMLVTIMAFPFLLYFDAVTERRNHRLFLSCETIIVVNFVVMTFLHLSGIQSYDRSLIYLDLMLLVYILVMIIITIRDYIVRADKRHRNLILGLVGLSLFGLLEIVVTIMSAQMPFVVDIGGLFVLIGMILLLLFAILDQVEALEEIKQETQNAIATTKAKSDFLANMSHEIRTPINAIMGMNEMILRETDQDVVKEYAQDVSSASENLLHIVNDILDFSKIESGKLEIIPDEYNLGELIDDVTLLVNIKAEAKGLKLSVDVDETLPTCLYGDDKRVRGIITNILNNAVKYTEQGYVKLKVDGESDEQSVVLRIVVEDSGQGIREEDLEKIFNGFSQVNTKKNKNIEGTGLGLAITKQLIELMNGSIEVQSEFGKGSVFTVLLPQQIVSSEKLGDYRRHRHASADSSGQETEITLPEIHILVVDDTPLNLKVISKLLGRTKAKVTCASSGEEMLSLVRENSYDVILLDHMMPNMDGIETLKQAKALPDHQCPEAPIIALTANAVVGAREMYFEAGFDDYLSKPIKMDRLCEVIQKHLK